MAVFTAIASAIVGAITGAGFAATFAAAGTLTFAGIATSILAGGIAMATSKALGVFKPPSMANAKDPGVKVQVAPSTDNKIPVFYGKNLTSGLITDAGISNSNDTMTYVIIIGEKTDSGTYTIGDQYRGDQKLNFGSGASSHIVTSVTDANGTAANDISGKMRVRIYAGGTASGNQIFPTTGTPVAATTLLSTIDGNTSYEGLVYVVFQIDYDQENGLTGLGQYTTEITNSLSEPGAVLDDYLKNSRYGAGLSASDIDATSIAAVTSYATEQVAFTTSGGASSTHDRWQINGMMGTYSNVFTNIDLICQACSTFFTYNPKIGKFQVVPNREATTGEKSAAYVFDDDNVIGAIDVTSTQLYSQYNQIEAEYPDGTERDQTATLFVTTPAGDLNANEPTNKLSTRYPICNDAPRVTNLAQIDLRQSRKDLVVQLEADYAAIQTDVGDIVKLTNTTYGFTDKLFRVMRVTEKESESGMLSVSVVLLEYDDSVYTHITATDTSDLPVTGIPGYWNTFGNSVVTVGNITVADNQNNTNANVVNSSTGAVVSTVTYSSITLPMAPSTGDIGGSFLSVPVTPATGTFFPQMEMKVTPVMSDGTEGTPTTNIYGQSANVFFTGGVTTNLGVDLKFLSNNPSIGNVASVRMAVNAANPYLGMKSRVTETANISFNAQNFVPNAVMATFGAGTQMQASLADKVDLSSGTTFQQLAPTEEFPITGSTTGDFAFFASGSPIGSLSSTSSLGFKSNIILTFSNGTTTAVRNITESGTTKNNIPTTSAIPNFIAAQEFSTLPTAQSPALTSDYAITNANVTLYGFSDLALNSDSERGFAEMNFNTIRVTKGSEGTA
jgi:hypothetical protein